MGFFFRKKRAPKAEPGQDSCRQSPGGDPNFESEDQGHNPYDTLPGINREDVGMRRRRSGKWSF